MVECQQRRTAQPLEPESVGHVSSSLRNGKSPRYSSCLFSYIILCNLVVRRWPAWRSSDGLEQSRESLTTTDAHGLQAELRSSPVHLTEQGGQNAAAGRADRVAERDPHDQDQCWHRRLSRDLVTAMRQVSLSRSRR